MPCLLPLASSPHPTCPFKQSLHMPPATRLSPTVTNSHCISPPVVLPCLCLQRHCIPCRGPPAESCPRFARSSRHHMPCTFTHPSSKHLHVPCRPSLRSPPPITTCCTFPAGGLLRRAVLASLAFTQPMHSPSSKRASLPSQRPHFTRRYLHMHAPCHHHCPCTVKKCASITTPIGESWTHISAEKALSNTPNRRQTTADKTKQTK